MKKFIPLLILLSCIAAWGQEPPPTQAHTQTKTLTPNELEKAKLGRLKTEFDTFRVQLQSLESQKQAIELATQLTKEHQQQKFSEYLGYAETIKQAHIQDKCSKEKDCEVWGSADQVIFDPTKGTEGIFTLNPVKQTDKGKEEPKSAIEKDAKEKGKEGKEVKK